MKGARSTVAKHKQTPTRGQPITSHPLFPAVVGLWFGALFGLGSLAVRPSLIEDLVLSTRIDLIIPAAAPPLGITARIMLALIMAVLGAIVGVVLARRLTRPKPEIKERARTVRGAVATAQTRQRARDAHPDAPLCTPISMQDLETGDDAQGAAQPDGRLAGRRRALTVEHVSNEFVPHEFAPLPGGAPQILDMAEMVSSSALPAAFEPPAVAAMAVTMPAVEPERQAFQSVPAAQPALPPECAAAHADGRQVFGMEPVNPLRQQPRQIFGVIAEGDHLPQDFVREAGYKTSVFETEVPKPLFEREPAELPPEAPAGSAFVAVTPGPVYAPQPADSFAVPSPSAPVAADPLPSPSSLGMTDLAARLAESMQRRRAARSAASAAAEPAAPASMPFAQLDQFAAPVVEETMAAVPAPSFVAPVAPQEQPIQFAAIAPSFVALTPVLEVPVQFTAPVQAQQPVVSSLEAAGDYALPISLRPLALDAFLEEDLAFNASLLPPRRLVAGASDGLEQPAAIPQSIAAAARNVAESAEEPIAEENYASLLGLGGQRTGFVRIEEPEADVSAPEPVVIFPGQASLGQAPQFTPPAPTELNDDGATMRRFDSPAAAEQGQPVDLGISGANMAPDEAAQALRTALASLQRISGAA